MHEKEHLHQLVDRLPDSEIEAAARYLEFLVSVEPPVGPDLLARIDQARANRTPGIPHEEILREFGQ